MIKNYVKVAIRNLLKYKAYSLINILGLAASSAVGIMILYYSYQVLTFDQYHEHAEDIYFVHRDRPGPEGATPVYDTWYPMLTELKNEYPDIISGVRFASGGGMLSYKDKTFEEEVYYADKEVFEVFDFDFAKGDPAVVFQDPYSMVLSSEAAVKYFGDEDPIGKTITLGGETAYRVTGVFGEIPANSSLDFEVIVPMHSGLEFIANADWSGSFLFTFVQLRSGTDPRVMEGKFPAFVEKFFIPSEKGALHLIALKDYHDEFSGDKQYVYILLAIALGILLIAAFNFTNLSTAHSLLRTKEVGVRKVLGATRMKLLTQFMTEAFIMSFLALIIGAALVDILLPAFNELVSMELEIDFFANASLLLFLFVLGIGITLIAGSYPALYLSGLQPQLIFQGGRFSKPGGQTLRNILVTFQFTLTIILISAIGVILGQVDYLKAQKLNFDEDQVVAVPVSPADFMNPEEGSNQIQVFKNELSGISGVEEVTASNSIPGRYRGWYALFLAEGQEGRDPFDWRYAQVGSNYFDTYGIELLEGRNFIEGSEADRTGSAIINEAAMQEIGWETAVGKKLLFPDSERFRTIVGVVKDFHYQSLTQPVRPVVHFFGGEANRNYSFVSVKINRNAMASTLPKVREKVSELATVAEVEPFFPNERFAQMYQTEEDMARLISYATILAIIIACLGLYALASFTTLQRTKEIAIRKILGATVPRIMGLILQKFALLIGIAFLVATPVAVFLANLWLEDFPYRMNLSPWIFILAGVAALTVAILTVSYHSIKAAYIDPADSLRYE